MCSGNCLCASKITRLFSFKEKLSQRPSPSFITSTASVCLAKSPEPNPKTSIGSTVVVLSAWMYKLSSFGNHVRPIGPHGSVSLKEVSVMWEGCVREVIICMFSIVSMGCIHIPVSFYLGCI